MGLRRRLVSFLLALAALPGGVRGQSLEDRARCFDAESGLPGTTVTALLQDRAGFLWIGTERGLVRYDGVAFRRVTIPSDPVGEVASLLQTSDGALWVGTNQAGLFRLDPRTERLHRITPPLAGVLSQMEEGPDRRPLLRIDAAGPMRLRWHTLDAAGRPHPFRVPGRPPVADVLRTPNGVLWVLYADGTAERTAWDAPTATRAPLPPPAPGAAQLVWHDGQPARRDATGAVWALSGTRLTDGAPGLFHPATPTRSGNGVVLHGTWWQADDRLTAWPPRGAPPPPAADALPDAPVLALAADRSGVLWVGTATRGLCRLDPAPPALRITSLTALHPRVTSDRLSAAAVSARGETFLATMGGILVRAPGAGAFVPVAPALPPAAARYFYKAVYRDRTGALWVASWGGGLWRLAAGAATWDHFPGTDARFDAIAARVVHEDRQGRLWVGSEAGLRRYVPQRDAFERPGRPDGPSLTVAQAPVWALHSAPDGALWVGTYQRGLCRFDPEAATERCIAVGESGGRGSISGLADAPGGALWASTYGDGLCRIDPDRIDPGRIDPGRSTDGCYTTADGLLDDVVLALLPDGRGGLWLSTPGGLSHVEPTSGTVQNVRLPRRTPPLSLANGVGARLPSGHLLFGGNGGLVQIHPDSVGTRTFRPPVRLTGVRFFDREVPVDALERTGGIVRLPPEERHVSFDFAALDLLAPERLRYRYRLDGFDATWRPTTSAPTATYTNLPPGRYTFRVEATNAAGVWNAVPLALPVEVVPPLWKRPWVLVLAGLALAVAFGGAIRTASTHRLRQRLQALEAERRVEAERQRISRELHDHVGAQMATVLSAAELVRLSARAGDEDAARRYAEIVATDTRKAMQQLRRAVESMRPEALTVHELAARIEEDACARVRLPGAPTLTVACDADPADTPRLSAPQSLHLFRIAQEALTNTLRHAAATRVEVRLRHADGRLRLTVRDDGAGFMASSTPAGNGLGNLQARAAEIGGTCRVRSTPGAGTAVEVEVPLA